MADIAEDDPFADTAGDDTDAFGDAPVDTPDADFAGDAADDLFGMEPENTTAGDGDAEGDFMGGGFDQLGDPSEASGGADLGAVETKAPADPAPMMAPEPEQEDRSALNEWNANRRAELEQMAAASMQRKQELKQAASDELAQIAAARQTTIETRAAQNRQDETAFLEQREALAMPGQNPWQRVSSLVDIAQADDSEKGAATDRMRSILFSMKNATQGPGFAAGKAGN